MIWLCSPINAALTFLLLFTSIFFYLNLRQRKANEVALRRSESELEAIYSNAPLLMMLVDHNRRIVKMNTVAESMSRRPINEVIGQRSGEVLHCIHATDVPEGCGFGAACESCDIRNTVLKTLQSGRSFHQLETTFTYTNENKSLTNMYLSVSTTPLQVSGEDFVLVCLEDITKRKLAEEALRTSEQNLVQAQKIARTGSWSWEIASDEIFWSDELYRITGLDRSHFKPSYETYLALVHPEDKEQYKIFKKNSLKEKNPYTTEYRINRPDGTEIHLLEQGEAQLGEDNAPVRLAGTIQDISEKKQAAIETKKLEERIRQSQKMEAIGTLAGGIAHDFNNILAAILGYTEMAREDCPVGSTKANDLEKVLEAGFRAKDLVQQILAFSRQSDTECIPLQPASIVKEAINMLRPSLPTTIEIKHDIQSGTSLIMVDPTQIHQILINLCTNASHAMEETGGTLEITLAETELDSKDIANQPEAKAGKYIKLTVSDTGPGIVPEIREKIFDPYFTTKAIGRGTGMGLSIVHGIVQSYGGFISLYSEVGLGTAFHLFIPVIEQALSCPYTANEQQIATGNERILFVDDEKMLAEMGKHMLTRLGYRVTIRQSSSEALELFQNQPDQFDLVITDQTMPGMTGAVLAAQMLKIRPDIPIILCTGYSTIISEEKAKSMGIKAFMLKPLTKNDIASVIRRVLDAKNPKLAPPT